MTRNSILLLFILLNFTITNAQKHLLPQNGADGISGTISTSFVIKWAKVDSASLYQYVLSDNPQCFAGCSGDTRNKTVIDTTGVEYNLQENKWYYWITRIYYQNGDTSHWSSISSFLAKPPASKSVDEFAIVQNPSINGKINLKIDWAVNPNAKSFALSLIDIHGHLIIDEVTLNKVGSERFQEFELPMINLTDCVYNLIIKVDDNQNNKNNLIYKNIVFF